MWPRSTVNGGESHLLWMRESVDNDTPGAPLQDRQQAMSQWHIALIKVHGGAELALERVSDGEQFIPPLREREGVALPQPADQSR